MPGCPRLTSDPCRLAGRLRACLSQKKSLWIRFERYRGYRPTLICPTPYESNGSDTAGNCWFLAALGSLTFQPDMLHQIIPQDQGFTQKYAGIFHFMFWRFGKWVDVVIDDKLPTLDGKYLFVYPRNKSEFWPSLLEKAYAKLCGSYYNMNSGLVSEALMDFTGGVNIRFNLKEPVADLWQIMKRAENLKSLMACGTPQGRTPQNTMLPSGIVEGHAYTVTGVAKVQCDQQIVELVRLWNPWGKVEWNGQWSDGMTMKDFKANYTDLNICNTSPDFLNSGTICIWAKSVHSGRWVKGTTAGGCFNNRDTFWMNPQYRVTLADSSTQEGLTTCNVVVSLIQEPTNRFRHQSQNKYIGFTMYKVGQWFLIKITENFMLPNGEYLVVPSTYKKDEVASFVLSIYSKTKNYTEEIGSNLNLNIPKDEEVDAAQLQMLLNEAVLEGIQLNDELLNLMALRYGDSSSRITLESYLCLMLRLECMATHRYHPCADSVGRRRTHAVLRSHPRATASEDNAALGQLTVKPSGAQPDYRGRWCAVTLGRGLAVTYRILSLACPLMISRNHCVFKQNEESQWTVTDKKSLNGVWVNGKRIEPYKAHLLNEGDTVQLGVPIEDKGVEYEYVLIKDQLQNVAPFLQKTTEQDTEIAPRTKRKYSSGEFDSEESSNSKEKVSLSFSVDKSRSRSSLATEMVKQKPNHCESATPGPSRDPQEALPLQDTQDPTKLQPSSQSSAELARLQDNMKRIQRLKIKVKEAEQQAASLQAQQVPEPQLNQVEEKLNVLRGQLHVEQQQQMLRVELLEKTFYEEEQRLEDEKKLQVEESLENKLDLALQEHRKVIEELRRCRKDFEEIIQAKDKELEETKHRKVIEELRRCRKDFEEIIQAKDKELEETKEEKEKAKAQKEEVLTQMTEVLENELQCIICSELFFEAVTLKTRVSKTSVTYLVTSFRKDECPICRQGIIAQTRSLVLDNCIDRMVENLSSEMKERRESLMRERKGESSVSGDGHDGNESSDFSSGSSISSVISTEESSSSSSSSSSWGSDTSSSMQAVAHAELITDHLHRLGLSVNRAKRQLTVSYLGVHLDSRTMLSTLSEDSAETSCLSEAFSAQQKAHSSDSSEASGLDGSSFPDPSFESSAHAWFNSRVFQPTLNPGRLLTVSLHCLQELSW
ncbi:UNVERIFIED_CONTAM: hypothetical protein FKN15_046544 [Acipenser sinensis]